jgi:hypothetical protein
LKLSGKGNQGHKLTVNLAPVPQSEKKEIVEDGYDKIVERLLARGVGTVTPPLCTTVPAPALAPAVPATARPKPTKAPRPIKLPTPRTPKERVSEQSQQRLDATRFQFQLEQLDDLDDE